MPWLPLCADDCVACAKPVLARINSLANWVYYFPFWEVRAVRQFAYGYLGYFGKVAGAVNLNFIEPSDGNVGELSVGVANDIDVIRDLGTGTEASLFILDLA